MKKAFKISKDCVPPLSPSNLDKSPRSMHVFRMRQRPGKDGIALVMVLAFVVLLTGVVIAYFSRTMTDRDLSNSSFNQAAADQLARSALAIITADLKQELVNGSTATTSGTTTVYIPAMTSYMLPQRRGVPGSWSTGTPNATLVRSSSTATVLFPAVDQVASSALITSTSANGRSVSLARWNQHYLIPLKNTGTPTDTTPDKDLDLATPSWVYVTAANGPEVLTKPVDGVVGRYAYAIYDESGLLDVNVAGYPSAMPYVSGNTMPSQYASKGSLAFADLTQLTDSAGNPLLTSTAANAIVGWRNRASLAGAGSAASGAFPNLTFNGGAVSSNYQNLINSNTNGFLTVSRLTSDGLTDQAFFSRQELISMAMALGSANFNPIALQYLGTFSRALTAPTWSPVADSNNLPDYGGKASGGAAVYLYKTNAEFANGANSTSTNPDLANVRFMSSGTVTHWNDGVVSGSGTMISPMTATSYAVHAGDLMLQRRFSLSKLAWLSQGLNPTGNYAAAIQACFGLISGNNGQGVPCWVYAGPTGKTPQSSIETLSQVAQENPPREPNFFELLKAAILNGSLGRDPGPGPNASITAAAAWAEVWGQQGTSSYNTPAGTNFFPYMTGSNSQIIQIGANIIDQYDADSIPTAIYFNAVGLTAGATASQLYLNALCNTFSGIENLPYLYALRPISWKPATTGTTPEIHYGWFQPGIWNPHEAPASARTEPLNFRLHAYGATLINDWSSGTPGDVDYDPNPSYPNSQYITFTDAGGPGSPFYNVPLFLTTDVASATSLSGSDMWQAAYGTGANNIPGKFVAFYGGGYEPGYAGGNSMIIGAEDPLTISVVMEYSSDGGNTWIPYSLFSRYDAFCGGGNNVSTTEQVQGDFDVGRIDPRTDRFSTQMGWPPLSYGTYWASSSSILGATAFTPSLLSGFTYSPGNAMVGLYSVNQVSTPVSTNAAYYADRDGVIRPGDAYRYNTATGDGTPTFITVGAPPGSPAAVGDATISQHGRRPIILNRPFQSVGELGYTFRDLPFKTLDFWSRDSADGALLDVFCVRDDPAPVVAGEVNPSRAPAPVLQAIIAGAAKKVLDPTYNISAEAPKIATAMANALAAVGPLANRAELATKLGPVVSGQSSTVSISGTAVNVAYNTSGAANADLANKAYAEAPIRALADVTNTRTWNLMIDVVAQAGSFAPGGSDLSRSFVAQGEKRYWLHIAIDRFTGEVIDEQLESVYE